MPDDPTPPATPPGQPPTPPWPPRGWYRGGSDPDDDGRPRFDWTPPPRDFSPAAARDWLDRAILYLEHLRSERLTHVVDGDDDRGPATDAVLLMEDYRRRSGASRPLPRSVIYEYGTADIVKIHLTCLRDACDWFARVERDERAAAAADPAVSRRGASDPAAVELLRNIDRGVRGIEAIATRLTPDTPASPAAEPRPRPFRIDRSDPHEPRVVRATDQRAEKVTDDAAVFLEMVLEADGAPVPSGEVAKRLGIEEFKVTRVMKPLPKWVQDYLACKTGSGTSLLRTTNGVRVGTSALQAFGVKHGIRPYRPTDRFLRGDPAKQATAREEIADLKTGRRRATSSC